MEIKSIEDSVLGLISSSSTQADNENSPFSITKRIEKILWLFNDFLCSLACLILFLKNYMKDTWYIISKIDYFSFLNYLIVARVEK